MNEKITKRFFDPTMEFINKGNEYEEAFPEQFLNLKFKEYSILMNKSYLYEHVEYFKRNLDIFNHSEWDFKDIDKDVYHHGILYFIFLKLNYKKILFLKLKSNIDLYIKQTDLNRRDLLLYFIKCVHYFGDFNDNQEKYNFIYENYMNDLSLLENNLFIESVSYGGFSMMMKNCEIGTYNLSNKNRLNIDSRSQVEDSLIKLTTMINENKLSPKFYKMFTQYILNN